MLPTDPVFSPQETYRRWVAPNQQMSLSVNTLTVQQDVILKHPRSFFI